MRTHSIQVPRDGQVDTHALDLTRYRIVSLFGFSADRNLICLTIETEHKSRRELSAAAPGHVTTQRASGNCDTNAC